MADVLLQPTTSMSLPLAYEAHAQDLHLPLRQVKAAYDFVSFLDKAPMLDFTMGNRDKQRLLKQLQVSIQDVADDLDGITCSNDMLDARGNYQMQLFWGSVLASVLVHKDRSRVLKCLLATLIKIHNTTHVLRRLPPPEEDIPEALQLHESIIRLLSCALPKKLFIIYRRSPDPDRLIHTPSYSRNLQKLSDDVRLLQENARTRVSRSMGCLYREQPHGVAHF